jgi:hypothetical protein
MRRSVVLLVIVGLAAAAAPATARSRLKVRVPRERTFYLVPGAERLECALSTDLRLADESRSCGGDTFEGVTEPYLGTEPAKFAARDGLPLRLDVSRPITGRVMVRSSSVWGFIGHVGVGEARLRARVTAVTAGEPVTVGETITEPYMVTPEEDDYVVEFRIDPDEALAGVRLDALALELEVTGVVTGHNHFLPHGSSSLTLPLAR